MLSVARTYAVPSDFSHAYVVIGAVKSQLRVEVNSEREIVFADPGTNLKTEVA